MSLCNRLYRFKEFGRELAYDVEGARAFFLNEVKAKFLDCFQKGKTVDESIAILQDVHNYSPEEITKNLNQLESEEITTSVSQIPHQKFSTTYALTLNVTQNCNLRCRYCYVEKSSSSSSIMTEDTARKAVDFIFKFKDLESLGISFYGGEPLLNFPVIKSTIEYASREVEKRGLPEVKYHLTTNGTLLTDEMIAFLKDYHINVMVSMDGPASIHDAVRVTPTGESTHSLVLDHLQKLMSSTGKHKISASGVVTNRGRLKKAYEYLSKLSLKDIKLSYVRYLEESNYALTDDEKRQYMDDMRDIAKECTELLLQGIRPPYYNFENNILHLWKRSKRRHFCPAGMRRFGISPGGDIYPCGPAAAMGESKLGILKEGLNKRGGERWAAFASFENRAECKKCWARYLCAGGCPLLLVRYFDEQRCEINQHSARLAIAIYTTVKEKSEMMLAALVDDGFLSYIKGILQDAKS